MILLHAPLPGQKFDQMCRFRLQCGRPGFDPWVGKIPPGEGNGYQLQYSGLESSMDCIVHGVPESDTTERWSLRFHFSSVAQSHPTLWDPMNRSTLGLPVHHQLPEFTQTHVHGVDDAIQPSHPLSSPSPPAPNPSQHQGLFQWINSSHEVAKVSYLGIFLPYGSSPLTEWHKTVPVCLFSINSHLPWTLRSDDFVGKKSGVKPKRSCYLGRERWPGGLYRENHPSS